VIKTLVSNEELAAEPKKIAEDAAWALGVCSELYKQGEEV
jgi:hypothetical protein